MSRQYKTCDEFTKANAKIRRRARIKRWVIRTAALTVYTGAIYMVFVSSGVCK